MSVVTERVVVVVVGAGSLPQAVREPRDTESAKMAAMPAVRRTEILLVTILKSFVNVYLLKSNLGSAEMFRP